VVDRPVGDEGEVRYLFLLYVALRTCTVLYGSDQTETKESAERIYEITNTFPVDEDVCVGGCLIPSVWLTELKPGNRV
jgi:hypothetical protein